MGIEGNSTMAGKWTVQLVIMTGALLMVLVFSGAFLDPPRLGARTGGAVHVVSRVSSPYRVGGNTHNRRPPERAHVGLRCGELAWLGPVSDALGCQEQVLAQPAAQCSHRHFVLADLGDNNCACAPPGSDCKRGSPEVRIAKVSSLYRVGGKTRTTKRLSVPPTTASPSGEDADWQQLWATLPAAELLERVDYSTTVCAEHGELDRTSTSVIVQ